jgi:hypothetical protein
MRVPFKVTGVLPHVKMRAWGFWLARVSVRV